MSQSEVRPVDPRPFGRPSPGTQGAASRPARWPAARGNNFDGLRLLAALLVVYGHAAVDGTGTIGLRLLMFFAISGYLIGGSWQSDPHPGRFLARRFLRLWPAYAVCIVVCAALSAVFPAPDMPEISRLASLVYLKNLGFAGIDWGFFPFRDPGMNKSLWMIVFEVDLYLAFALLAVLFGTRLRWLAALVMLLAMAGSRLELQVQGGLLESWSLKFAGYFAAGLVLRGWPALRSNRNTALWIALGALLFAAGERPAGIMLLIPAIAVWVGERSWPLLRSAARHGDLSLGVFLWAWPLQQVSLLWLPQGTPPTLRFVVVAAQALALAALSWRLVERPAQRWRPPRPGASADLLASATEPGALLPLSQAPTVRPHA